MDDEEEEEEEDGHKLTVARARKAQRFMYHSLLRKC